MPSRYQLIYSRSIHDKRIYGNYTYEAAITPIVKALFREEIEEAKKRITITNNGKYSYIPSRKYREFLKKHIEHDKTKNKDH